MRTRHLSTFTTSSSGSRTYYPEHNHHDNRMVSVYFKQMIVRSNEAVAKIRYEANPENITSQLKEVKIKNKIYIQQ